MPTKFRLLVVPAALLALLSLSLYFGRDHVRNIPLPKLNGNVLPSTTITSYVKAINDNASKDHERLECPKVNTTRYNDLKITNKGDSIEYFFALDLRQCLNLLPTLMGSILEAMRFLGPERCALSIVEGASSDGTGEVLAAMRHSVQTLGAKYFIQNSDVNSREGDRIQKLADLRNKALQPLLQHVDQASNNTVVVFINDVAICTEDILELIHQRHDLKADMTCAMDWNYWPQGPRFYDAWITRGMTGDTLFEVPADGSWDRSEFMFWNDKKSKDRFYKHLPVQVFSCWNGAVAFSASILTKQGIRFRASNELSGECHQGEPLLFNKDMWAHGRGKVAIVPTINLGYTVNDGKKLKKDLGFVSDHLGAQNTDSKIEWVLTPPETVKCIVPWKLQWWQYWNVGLEKTDCAKPSGR